MKRFIAILLVALVATLGVWYLLRDSEPEDVASSQPETTPVEVEVDEERFFQIDAVIMDEYGVHYDSDFKLTTDSSMTSEKLMNDLVIEPATTFDVEKINDQEYLIKPTGELLKNTIYVFKYDEYDYGKAFQTIDKLNIVEKYPGSDAQGVPKNSIIELFFNSKTVTDVESYFSIEPELEGTFEYKDEKITFVPEGFEPGTLYKVTIKKGLTDGDRVLEEDYVYEFETGFSDDFVSRVDYTLLNASPNEDSVIMNLDYNESDSYHMTIYQAPSFEAFKAYYDLIEKRTQGFEVDFDIVYEEDITPVNFQYKDYMSVPPLERGRYIIETQSTSSHQYTFYQVDDLQYYYLQAVNGELIWAMDHSSKKPVQNVKMYNDDELLGQTSEDGTLLIEKQVTRDYVLEYKDQNYLVRTFNDMPYYYDHWYGSANTNYWSFIYTDRPAYLPDDTIEVFGYVRSFTDEPIGKLELVLTTWWGDDEEDIVQEVTLKDHQTFSGSIDLAGLTTGYYSVQLRSGDEILETKDISITNYEKPELYIESSIDKSFVFDGDTINFSIAAKYFNELPYEGLSVEVLKDRARLDLLTTDENGLADTDIEIISARHSWQPFFQEFSTRNIDAQNTMITSYTSVEVFPRDIMILMDTKENDGILTVNVETAKIDTSNYNGIFGENYSNIKGESIDVDYTIKIEDRYTVKTFVETRINPIHKVKYDVYDYTSKTEMLETITGSTLNGLDSFSFPVEDEHNYTITLYTKDQEGRETKNKIWYGSHSGYRHEDDVYTMGPFSYEDRYDIGDVVKYDILKTDEPVEDTDQDYLLNLKLRNGILDHQVSDKPSHAFEFKVEDRPNVLLKAVYYDGRSFTVLPRWSSQFIGYDYETLEATIDYQLDKEEYGPSDEAVIEFNVTKDEKPFNGVLNVSMVDESYFAVYEDYFELGSALHSYIHMDGVLLESMTLEESADNAFGAEAGEGGDGDYIRDDFKDTAHFEQVIVKDGKAKVSVKLPDNLTSWRLTLHAVNDQLEYGELKGQLKVVLPYFTRSISNMAYLTGDELYFTVSSDGELVEDDSVIVYKGSLSKGDVVISEAETQGTGKDYAHLKIGVLESGDYTSIVESAMGDYKDGIKETLIVRDYFLETEHRRSSDLIDDYQLKYDRDTSLYIYNQAAIDYLNRIYDATYKSNRRLEEKLGTVYANKILSEYFNVEGEEIEVSDYQDNDGGLKPLLTGDSMIDVTAYVMGTHIGEEYFNMSKMKKYLQNKLDEGNYYGVQAAQILWALSAQGEPVLIAIDNHLENNEDIGQQEKLYLAMALAELGDSTRAKNMIQSILDESLEGLDDKTTLLCGAYSKVLGLEYDLFDESYSESIDSADTVALQKLFYIQKFPVTFDETAFTYTLNGEVVHVELPDLKSYKLKVGQGDDLSFSDVGKNIVIDEWMTIYSSDYKDYKDNDVSLSVSYDENIEFGDRVKITYDYGKPSKETAIIKSRVPAGLEFVGSVDGGVYYDDQTIYMYVGGDKTSGKIDVYFSAVQKGRYNFESSVIQVRRENMIHMTEPKMIEVSDD